MMDFEIKLIPELNLFGARELYPVSICFHQQSNFPINRDSNSDHSETDCRGRVS